MSDYLLLRHRPNSKKIYALARCIHLSSMAKTFTIWLQGRLKKVIHSVCVSHHSSGRRCDSDANAPETNSGGRKREKGKKKKKKAYVFFYQQHAIIYLRMKHKLPGTLVTMATIKSIAELFWHLSPLWFFAGCKETGSTVRLKAVRQHVWSFPRHKMSVEPPAEAC